jgi:hypothetical protein
MSRIANPIGYFMFFSVPMFQLIISKQLLRVGGSLRAIVVVVVLAQKWIDLISRHISVIILLLLNKHLLLLIEQLLLLHYMLLNFRLR